MSLAQLFFSEKNAIGDATTGVIEFDVTVSESATAKARATKNPVENGADITDHVIIEPMTFGVSGIVSNTPVKYLAGIQSGTFLTGNRPAKTAWDKLLELQASREPFVLAQGLKSYSNIIITGLSTTTDATTGGSLFFSAEMEEIILVGTQELRAFNFKEPDISDCMLPVVDLGLKDF